MGITLKQIKKVTREIVALILLFTFTLTIHFANITPVQQGFFCNDLNLKYPYIENETISAKLCFTIWILIAFSVIFATQIITKSFSIQVINNIVWGMLICILLTDILKFSVGKLRPHFLTICNPDFNNICFDENAYYIYEDGEEVLDEFFERYVNETDICSTQDLALINEARLAFPSGHASYSFYFATSLNLYMNKTLKDYNIIGTILPYINLLLMLLASWISCTRITDFYHDTVDIICGAFAGVAIAIFCYYNHKRSSLMNTTREDCMMKVNVEGIELQTQEDLLSKNKDVNI